jgi:hypothetical protein
MAANTTRRGIVELFTVLSAEATAADHPAHGWFRERYARITAELENAYAQAQAAGDLRRDLDPPVASRQLVALMDGLQVQWLLSGQPVDMAGVLADHLATQLRTI